MDVLDQNQRRQLLLSHMSYSLPMRVLETLTQNGRTNRFQENVGNVLNSSIALDRKMTLMHAAEGRVPSLQNLEAPWREIACLDLSPTGLFLAHARSYSGVIQLWDAYAEYSDVIDASVCRPDVIIPKRSVLKVHARLLEGYGAYFEYRIDKNRRQSIAPNVDVGFNITDVARIFNVSSLLQDACDFFLAYPQSRVSDLYRALGLHPRSGERRFSAEGVSAIAIKRACAISSASRYIFWSNLTLAEIARKFGYTDGAHLHHEFKRSTGGIPPSVYRRAAQLLN